MSGYLLSGLKVIDCATVIAAPAAAMILADFGADVIKVEQPGQGDMLRMLSYIPTTPDAASNWFWQQDGRNKRSITLNLKTPAGLEVLHRLVGGCDVFITNHPYSVRESIGLTYEDLKPLNERMIYASLTAYGEQGTDRARKGFDQLAYWARSGLMELMREPGTRPTQGLPGMGDHPTAVALYAAIVTALLNREKTGKGGIAHTSLLANGLWSASGIAQGAMAGGDMPGYRERNRVPLAVMRPYRTSDDRWLLFNMIRDTTTYDALLIALEADALLIDKRFATPEQRDLNRQSLGEELQLRVETRTLEEWMAIFQALELPVHPVALVEETPEDHQILENRMAVAPEAAGMEVPLLINHPIKIDTVAQVEPRPAPGLGEHCDEILNELGYSPAEIVALRENDII